MIPFSIAQLRRVFKVVNGGTPTSDSDNWDGDVPWATPVDLGAVNGQILTATNRSLTPEGLVSGSAAVPPGSLIVSTRAPIGYVAQVSQKTAFNQGCRGLVPLRPVDIRYYRYQLLSMAATLQSHGQGSTFVELSTDGLCAMPICTPRLGEQRAIADYLDAETARLDALLDKKQKMAQLVKERAQATIEDLLMPWDRVPLRRLAKRIDVGIAEAATHAYSDQGIALIRSTNIRPGYLDLSDLLYIEPWFAERNRSKYVLSGDILTVRTGNAGVSAVVTPDLDRCQCFTQLITTLRDGESPDLVCTALNSRECREYFGTVGWGSAQANISVPLLGNAPVPLIPRDQQASLLSRIECIAGEEQGLRDRLRQQLSLMSERRQALITAAVTGEIEVPGVAA